MTVAELLAMSRQAHRDYRQIHHQTNGIDLTRMASAVQRALSARLEAEDADPGFTDQAWTIDAIDMKASHEALVSFYARYLSPVEVFAQAV